jgi:hypothetical protein
MTIITSEKMIATVPPLRSGPPSWLLNNLAAHDKTFGVETMCVGGGQGMAMIVERLS